MKYLFVLLMSVFLSTFTSTVDAEEFKSDEDKLKILTWSGLISPAVKESFEKAFGVEVEFTYYHNIGMRNDLLKNKYIRSYDVIITSSTSLHELIHDGSVEKLNFKNIKNYANIDHALVSSFNYSEYAIALNYSSLGIVYRKDKIEVPPKTWSDFTQYIIDNPNRATLPRNPYDIFSVLYLSKMGKINNITQKDLFEAGELFSTLDDYVSSYYFPTMKKADPLLIGQVYIGPTYNFYARKLVAENENIGFYYPSEGTRVWIDSISVLSHSKMKKEAYQFLDYLLLQESAFENFKFNGNSSTNFMHDYTDVISRKVNKDNKLLLPDESVTRHTVHKYDSFISDKEFYFYGRIIAERNNKGTN